MRKKSLKLRPLLFITFPQGFQNTKMFGHETLASGGKKNVKLSDKHRYQKILLSKAKFIQKLTFFGRQFYTLY